MFQGDFRLTVTAFGDRKGDQFTEAVLGSRWIEPSADTIPRLMAVSHLM